ncbi:unnamed protein product [Parascedosporium putredinis]|uniref:Uncharacterized protein n=1 Tax=Parascedosporium putredinis TaxID=1442378 RepID=A0A9P1GV04_9PEZI|nr:unnamed protein product [Parascedosporium putredinis]CAI7987846.1 unnamed protein product [Parascedosporium putredinis]
MNGRMCKMESQTTRPAPLSKWHNSNSTNIQHPSQGKVPTQASVVSGQGTTLVSNPNLMNSASIHVDPLPHTVGNPLRGLIPRVGDGQPALEDEMGSQAIVRMRAIMSVPRSRTTRLH